MGDDNLARCLLTRETWIHELSRNETRDLCSSHTWSCIQRVRLLSFKICFAIQTKMF